MRDAGKPGTVRNGTEQRSFVGAKVLSVSLLDLYLVLYLCQACHDARVTAAGAY